jgi:hypothetical protein
MLATKTAVLVELQFIRSILLVFGRSVVALLAFSASESDYIAHSHCPQRLHDGGRVLIGD